MSLEGRKPKCDQASHARPKTTLRLKNHQFWAGAPNGIHPKGAFTSQELEISTVNVQESARAMRTFKLLMSFFCSYGSTYKPNSIHESKCNHLILKIVSRVTSMTSAPPVSSLATMHRRRRTMMVLSAAPGPRSCPVPRIVAARTRLSSMICRRRTCVAVTYQFVAFGPRCTYRAATHPPAESCPRCV